MTDLAEHNDRQWQLINRILHKRNKPTIFWISCDDYLYREELVNEFELHFPELEQYKLSLKKFSEDSFQSYFKNNLPDHFLASENSNRIVHLVDIESRTYPHLSEDRTSKVPHEEFIRILNFEREILFNTLPFHIVFWSDTLSMKRVQRYAPDFYDWVSYKLNFESFSDGSKRKDTYEIAHKSQGVVSDENVIYNRISRRLGTLETISSENVNDRFTLLIGIARDYYSVNDYTKAENVIQEALKLTSLLPNQVALVKLFQGTITSKLFQYATAKQAYVESLEIYRELTKENPRTYLPSVATTLNNLANLHSANSEFLEALEYYEESLKICRDLAKENPQSYLPDVAMTLNNLAVLHSDKNEFPQALEYYEESLKIRRELAKENPRTYLRDIAMTLNNLAILQKEKNEFPQALENYLESLKIYRELAKENPRTYLPDVAMTLNNLGILHSDQNEFSQVLEYYEESLKIFRELARENPRTYLPNVAMTLNNLAVLLSNKNELPQALENYEESLKIFRELAKENPQIYEIDYAKSLIMGVQLFGSQLSDLSLSEEILRKYENVPLASELLDQIHLMRGSQSENQ